MSLLREVFGPSKEEIWSQIAADIGGEFVDGGFWGKDALVYQHGQWQVVLDTYTVTTNSGSTTTRKTYTRMRAPFVNKDGLYFKLFREGFFSKIGTFLGLQDLEVGDPFFDDQFVIRGNDPRKIIKLFSDEKLKELLSCQPDVHLEVKDDEGWFGPEFGEDVDQLYFLASGVIKQVDVLKELFELFACVLNRLVEIDSAYGGDPGVTLS